MSQVTCAISGLRFQTNFCNSLTLPANEGFPHPIFAAPTKYLERMYSQHTRGNLNAIDSYLLFLALAHSSDSIYWEHPVTLDPTQDSTQALVENNIHQLISVLHKTRAIKHPSFQQPKFKVTYENSKLLQIPNWIKAWHSNIEHFHRGRATQHELDNLHEVEVKLSKLILSGESPERYSYVVADWADKAACFPDDKAESYKQVIRACFNTNKMFNTPLALIKEIKEYCEANIEVGSIHFHTLSKVLNEGISRHIDYLGGSSLALGYTLLPPSSNERSCLPDLDSTATEVSKEQASAASEYLASLVASTTSNAEQEEPPKRERFPDNLSFLKAKLEYRVKSNAVATAAKKEKAAALKAKIAATSTSSASSTISKGDL